MKVLQACSGGEIRSAWTGTIRRLTRRYLERRDKQRVLREDGAEDRIAALYEGRRWCDATERELIGEITDGNSSHF